MVQNLIAKEEFTSVQETQAKLSKLLERASRRGSFYRVLKNNKPIGVLFPNATWDEILEDLEMVSSEKFANELAQAEAETRFFTDEEIKKEIGYQG